MIALADRRFADVRGFNYMPSWAATVWDVVDRFDPETFERELGFSKRLGANTLRVWTDVLSFQRDEEAFLAAWRQAFASARAHDLRLVVVLANRWVDELWWFGGVNLTDVLAGRPTEEYRRYLTSFVSAFRDEPAVLMWDLCNEPFHPTVVAEGAAEQLRAGLPGTLKWDLAKAPLRPVVPEACAAELLRLELGFWREAAASVREARPTQPLTMALQRLHPYDHEAADELVDVLSAHMYHGAWEGPEAFGAHCDATVAAANAVGKPLIASELCPGSKDAAVRSAMMRASVGECERRGIGWCAWQLMAGRIVSSRWDRYDRTCPPDPDEQAVMYFLEQDGTPRAGHALADWKP